jgi:Zn-dependent peptidase ImmA (M78 family)
VEAFQKLPDKKIIIIHGQNDPQKQKIFDLAH